MLDEDDKEMKHNSDKTKNSTGSDDDVIVDKPFVLKDFYDYDQFPESKGYSVLSWTHFTRDFLGLDKVVTNELHDICEKQSDKLVDIRPYMIENPETCTKFDFLPKILSRFTSMHLRHLIVVNPVTGHLEGMITRQDIFKWMPL